MNAIRFCVLRLEAAMRISVDKRRFYKPNRLLSFPLPFGTQARYVRWVSGLHHLRRLLLPQSSLSPPPPLPTH